MKIVLCDDEPFFLEQISEFCNRLEQEQGIPIVLLTFSCGKEVLEYYKTDKNIDLFILDIKMKELNGLKVAREIKRDGNSTKVVFLTSRIGYAPKGYEIGISRYWMKPLGYSKFCEEIRNLEEQIKREKGLYIIENIGTRIEKVYFDDILYIETKGRKTCVHKLKSSYLSTTKMAQYERNLDERFFRCHAAYIVNMGYIKGVKNTEIILNDGTIIYMSRGKKKKFISMLGNYLRDISFGGREQ